MTLTEEENVFEYLNDEIATVQSILEAIYFKDDDRYELSAENKATILALDNIHYYHDDLFNLLTNKIFTEEDVLETYHIKLFGYGPKKDFKEPKELSSLSIMEVFEYDLKRST